MLVDYGNLSHDFCIDLVIAPIRNYSQISYLLRTFHRCLSGGAWQPVALLLSTLAMMLLFHIRAQRHANPRPYYHLFRTFDSPALYDDKQLLRVAYRPRGVIKNFYSLFSNAKYVWTLATYHIVRGTCSCQAHST